MTPLGREIARRIELGGPITVAEYMAECLTHPRHGYYVSRDPFGAAGDFVTAPEISQMFGELLGLCLARTWLDHGAPARFVLAEAGPGRGTLMADMLRATRGVPGFHEALSLHLLEVSPQLRAAQAARLAAFAPSWHDGVDDLPDGPLYLVANEFLDALPIRQFLREGQGWSERMVGLLDGRLTFARVPVGAVAALADRLDDTVTGDLVERGAAARSFAEAVARRIASAGGAALLVDYGAGPSLGDTLQAVAAHRPVDPLAEPGAADLTAHVDFGAIAQAARSAGTGASAATPQGAFLNRLGLAQRAEALTRHLDGDALQQHQAAYHRLTHPNEMGHLFKVMSIHPRSLPPPPGLDP